MTQQQSLSILKTGASVFLTGEPGSGKTYVLNQYISYLRKHQIHVAITASTGIAATHIGGVTIHSWSGMGVKSKITDKELDALEGRRYLWKRFEDVKVLIIDEISMLSADQFETLNSICQAFKRNKLPFGGIQMVLVGDFFQLPPISKKEEKEHVQFAFETHAWKNLKPLVCYLEEQHRQDEGSLLGILQAIRKGGIDDGFSELEDRLHFEFEDIVRPTRLYTHNADVDVLNYKELENLSGESSVYTMTGNGKKEYVGRLQESCLSPEVLHIKIGAVVICTKNNFEKGYVNGTLGEVVSFCKETGYPIIVTNKGREIVVEPVSWSIEDGDKILAFIEQVPLRLAWAITIHKSQGMSLDAVELDLSRVFEYGQGYVALSRARSMDGLKLLGFNPSALVVHPKIISIDSVFKKQSSQIVEYFITKNDSDLQQSHQEFILRTGGSLEEVAYNPEQEDVCVSTYEQTASLVREKKSIGDISKEREITQETVISHLEKLLDMSVLDISDVQYLKLRTKKFKDLVAAFQDYYNETGELYLNAIKNKSDDSVSYFEIRLARLFLEK